MNYKRRWIAICLTAIPIGLYIFCYLSSPIAHYLHQEKRINGLIIGCAELPYSKHADSIIFLSYQPKNKFLDIFSLPRDTWIEKSGFRTHKLTNVYAAAYRTKKDEFKSAQTLTKIVSSLLGVETPFFLQLNYQNFKEVMKIIGKVKIYLDQDMHYDDYAGNLHIHLKKGEQILSSKESLDYVRFRGGVLADRERILRQQKFLRTVLGKLVNPIYLFTSFRVNKIKNLLNKSIITNINFYDVFAILLEMRNISKSNVRFQQLPGTLQNIKGISYWFPDKIVLSQIISLINSSGDIKPSGEIPVITNNFEVEKIVAEVWNATRKKDLALQITHELRQQGVDVVRWGNYGEYRLHTTVIDRAGNFRKAQKIARLLNNCEIATKIDPHRLVDVSIVVGNDLQ